MQQALVHRKITVHNVKTIVYNLDGSSDDGKLIVSGEY